MTHGAARRRTPPAARRFGYVVAVLINAAMWYAVNRWPGWDVLPFLTDETRRVLNLVNVVIIANLVANLIYLLRDPPWLKALGDIVTTALGTLAAVRIWQVFPFEFAEGGIDWALVVRVLLAVAIVGGAIGIVAAVVKLVRHRGTGDDAVATP
jgi:uncharacterized integral membrane protein